MLPFLMITVVPFLIIVGVVYLLRPEPMDFVKNEVEVEPWKTNYNVTYRPSTYISSSWRTAQQHQDEDLSEIANLTKTTPIFDEFEALMRESEIRMEESIKNATANLKASAILHELGIQAKERLTV